VRPEGRGPQHLVKCLPLTAAFTWAGWVDAPIVVCRFCSWARAGGVIIGGMTEYSEEERQTIRTAAFGALFLVSKADPGFFDMMKESFAGSKALANSSPDLRGLFKGGLPKMPKSNPAELEPGILGALSQSAAILQTKGQPELESFRSAVTSAVDQVAQAAGGVSSAETEAIGKVKAAIGAT
jgi:hypothetical protein